MGDAMKSVETEGKTIEEAISKACEELKASREDLEIEILTNGSSGFLGLVGAKKAQIRATVKKTAPAAPGGASTRRCSQSAAAETAKKTLQDILRLLGIEAGVQFKEEPERIVLNIERGRQRPAHRAQGPNPRRAGIPDQ